MRVCIVYQAMLAAAHGTQGILLRSLSQNWLFLHLHILCGRWQTQIHFNKTGTAVQLQTTVHAADFIFNLGVTVAT